MMKVPMSWAIAGIIAALAAGFGAGWGLRKDQGADLLKAQAQSIDTIIDHQTEIITKLNEPVVIDAEIRATLAQTPPSCVTALGGDPSGPACLMVTCWSYGQTAAQRPECHDLQKQVMEILQSEWEKKGG
jgi:hypothetical protein